MSGGIPLHPCLLCGRGVHLGRVLCLTCSKPGEPKPLETHEAWAWFHRRREERKTAKPEATP